MRGVAGAVQLRNAITERFGIELPPTAALDFPTVQALAGYVVQSVAPASAASLALHAGTFDLEKSYWSDCSGRRLGELGVWVVPQLLPGA